MVVVDRAGGLGAEDVVEVQTLGAVVDVGEKVGSSEAGVVVLERRTLEELIGRVDRGDLVAAQGLDESILPTSRAENLRTNIVGACGEKHRLPPLD